MGMYLRFTRGPWTAGPGAQQGHTGAAVRQAEAASVAFEYLLFIRLDLGEGVWAGRANSASLPVRSLHSQGVLQLTRGTSHWV